MLLICKKIIYLILLCPKNAAWPFSFSNDPWVQTFVLASILQCFLCCLGLRAQASFLDLIMGGLPFHLWVFWKVIIIIYRTIPKKIRSHMEQHKIQHISSVEIHNLEPTFWSNHLWRASFSPSSFKSKSPLNKVQREAFFFDGMFSSLESNLCLKMNMKLTLVEG